MSTTVASYIAEREGELDRIPQGRRGQLEALASFIRDRRTAGRPVRLTFICTHNSRRSHMAQLWARTAAAHYGIEGVETFSGGTEATAFDRRAVAAMKRAGFQIEEATGGENPVYEVRSEPVEPAVAVYSKIYDRPPNPTEEFVAVMTCSDADAACPVVQGCALRVAIPYEDPKLSDGSERETATYDERCRQISGEMLYLFSKVALP